MEQEYQHILSMDAAGRPLEGGKCYKLHLKQGIPASDFWSVIVYDNATNLIIRNDQLWPSVHSNSKKLLINQDGSVDVWFGPKLPAGKKCNWVQTNAGKRLAYDPAPLLSAGAFVKQVVGTGEIEEVKII